MSPKPNVVSACVGDLPTGRGIPPGVQQTRVFETVLAVPGSRQGWLPCALLELELLTQVRGAGQGERCGTAAASHYPWTESRTHLVCGLTPDHFASHSWDWMYYASPSGQFLARRPPFGATL